ncbi:hypothetical protein LAWI1_G003346 [Lachnellula willkommii]|uniref:Uncharacterized protein n=1 Tax=Lachnellula willkommii TaxID=215461 RepID=A0A559M7Q4_9HELO|nr:hypothetical protein LAWI1_G003346 [Lachnellula willkommii]
MLGCVPAALYARERSANYIDQLAVFGNNNNLDNARTRGQVKGASSEAHITRIKLDTNLYNLLLTLELASALT